MSLLTRLLYNLELQIGKVLITCQLAQPNSEFKLKASLSINSLSLRNTVLVLGANIVKKTLTLGQLAIVVTLHNSVTLPNALQHTSTVLNADNALKTQKIGSGVLCVSF